MMYNNPITVVSGLPRSGTSLLMQMLFAGGMEIYSDQKRPADENNPRGYYEHETVKNLHKNASFLQEVQGKAVKIISSHLMYLPQSFQYNILFLRRNLDEIILSQNIMLEKLNAKVDNENPEEIKKEFLRHLHAVHLWLQQQENVRFIYVDHSSIINEPGRTAEYITEFLQIDLDIPKMTAVVDLSLYRTKSR